MDKFYRLAHGANWFPDEQPSDEIKRYLEDQIAAKPFDIVLSHTCPFKYEPTEVFLPTIDQSTVDTLLFNTITETIQRLESIKAGLIFAQQRAEELVISKDE